MAWSSRMTLKLVGIKLILPAKISLADGPYFITFNHNSYLDIFALTAMGYTNTRFLLSEKTIKIIPFTLSALAIGVVYIPQKKQHDRRMKLFYSVEELVKNKKVNIAGSSEGVHEHHHGIDKFNKGVYHMATICKMNIIPFFIYVPKASNPFNKYKHFKRGTITIVRMPTINTQNWQLKDLEINKEMVRDLYIKQFNEFNQLDKS